MQYGVIKGEQCNRDGCTGIIDEHEKEGECRCHINPPCSYCTTEPAFCPECGWDCNKELDKEISIAKSNEAYYSKRLDDLKEDEDKFTKMVAGQVKATQLTIRSYSHSNSSMVKKGVFPPGSETRESILPKVEGTFGGRFTKFDPNKGVFEYIAYTD